MLKEIILDSIWTVYNFISHLNWYDHILCGTSRSIHMKECSILSSCLSHLQRECCFQRSSFAHANSYALFNSQAATKFLSCQCLLFLYSIKEKDDILTNLKLLVHSREVSHVPIRQVVEGGFYFLLKQHGGVSIYLGWYEPYLLNYHSYFIIAKPKRCKLRYSFACSCSIGKYAVQWLERKTQSSLEKIGCGCLLHKGIPNQASSQ
jgi:hypothetical protein